MHPRSSAMIPIAPLALLLALAQSAPPSGAARERWVLRLLDGSVVRVVAREVDGGWEVRTGQAWERVPRRDVRAAVREREALAQIAARRTKAGADLEQRAAVARLALDAGLLDEAVAELDAILAADPDQAAARALVAAAPLALTLPAGDERSRATRLVLFGARAKPAWRELAAARLAVEPRAEARGDLARGLASPSASVRAFSAFALRRLDPRAQADALVRRAVLDPSERVRLESARALRDARDETLARRVAAALELSDARLRTAASASLAEMGYPAAVPALTARLAALQAGGHPGGTRGHVLVGSQVAYVRDFDVQIAQGASIADPIVGVVDDATELDVRVGGVSTLRVETELRGLCRALARLTGLPLPEKPEAWLAWWERNSQRWAAPQADPAGASGR